MTPFQRKVYSVVCGIPLGKTRSYGWVAAKAGKPRAGRAVGNILNKNPYPLIVPCHRVVKKDDKPGGYRFGCQRKRLLLEMEKELARCLKNKS